MDLLLLNQTFLQSAVHLFVHPLQLNLLPPVLFLFESQFLDLFLQKDDFTIGLLNYFLLFLDFGLELVNFNILKTIFILFASFQPTYLPHLLIVSHFLIVSHLLMITLLLLDFIFIKKVRRTHSDHFGTRLFKILSKLSFSLPSSDE